MKTVTLSFGQAISYKAPKPDCTLVCSAGNGMKFVQFKSPEAAKEALYDDRAKANGKGYRELHPRNK